jgi:hypothetical protein
MDAPAMSEEKLNKIFPAARPSRLKLVYSSFAFSRVDSNVWRHDRAQSLEIFKLKVVNFILKKIGILALWLKNKYYHDNQRIKKYQKSEKTCKQFRYISNNIR